MNVDTEELKQFMASVDLSSSAGLDDKAEECRFFLALAETETDRARFRWLVSAFLSAAYSYFEHTAFWACIACTDEDTGEDIPDEALLSAVREHVDVKQNKKYTSYVQTTATRGILKRLYALRHENAHLSPLSIMSVGLSLPEDFHLGWKVGSGFPLLAFCKEVMTEIGQLQCKAVACEAGAWPPPSQDFPEDY